MMTFFRWLGKQPWFWKGAALLGCLFFMGWSLFFLVALIDSIATGAVEWAPWSTAEEVAKHGEYIAGYCIALFFGLIGSVYLVRWSKGILYG